MHHLLRAIAGRAWAVAAAGAMALALLWPAPPAQAQIIYEPVQYQYRGTPTFYYGGSDPAVFEQAERVGCLYHHRERGGGLGGRANGYLSSRVLGPRQYVYSDCAPYMNLWLYGFTPTDARNEAYRNVPRHFRKSDLKRAAVRAGKTLHVVPAQAKPVRDVIVIRRDRAQVRDEAPARTRRIIIIPKKAPKNDRHKAEGREVADATR